MGLPHLEKKKHGIVSGLFDLKFLDHCEITFQDFFSIHQISGKLNNETLDILRDKLLFDG